MGVPDRDGPVFAAQPGVAPAGSRELRSRGAAGERLRRWADASDRFGWTRRRRSSWLCTALFEVKCRRAFARSWLRNSRRPGSSLMYSRLLPPAKNSRPSRRLSSPNSACASAGPGRAPHRSTADFYQQSHSRSRPGCASSTTTRGDEAEARRSEARLPQPGVAPAGSRELRSRAPQVNACGVGRLDEPWWTTIEERLPGW